MVRILTRVSISQIISAVRSIPKFNLEYNESWYRCFDNNAFQNASLSISNSSSSGSSSASTNGSGETIINNYPTTIINNASYQLAVKTGDGAGHPVQGQSSYQNDLLKNSSDINFIILAKQILSKLDNDFSINATTGTVTLTSMTFYNGDTLIIPYNKTS